MSTRGQSNREEGPQGQVPTGGADGDRRPERDRGQLVTPTVQKRFLAPSGTSVEMGVEMVLFYQVNKTNQSLNQTLNHRSIKV